MTDSEALYSRSRCPVTNVLDIIGDRWSLLIIRDIYLGKRTFKEFSQSPEGISTNILANRLSRLEEEGIIRRLPYNTQPLRYCYELTTKGEDLLPVLQEIVVWGKKYIPGIKIQSQQPPMVQPIREPSE